MTARAVATYFLGMYLRITKRRNADGSEVCYYQLAESVWNASRRCSVTNVLFNFGRADQLDLDMLKRLAESILRVVEPAKVKAVGPSDMATSPGVRIRDAWPYGGIYVLEHLWKEVGIGAELNRCAKGRARKQPFERALFVMVANRAALICARAAVWPT